MSHVTGSQLPEPKYGGADGLFLAVLEVDRYHRRRKEEKTPWTPPETQ